MADAYGFVRGETLEIITEWLDDILDEEFNEEIQREADEVTHRGEFFCSFCSREYKTRGGLFRHISLKHSAESTSKIATQFEWEQFCSIFDDAQQTIVDDKCYSNVVKESIAACQLTDMQRKHILENVQAMFIELANTGNAEHFYSEYYGRIILKSKEFFPSLYQPLCSLFAKRLGDKLFASARKPVQGPFEKPSPITAREMGGLQYLSGYVVHKLLKKVKNQKNYLTKECQLVIQLLSIFLTKDVSRQALIEATSRGELTAVTRNMQQIVIAAEEKFREETSIYSIRKIDINKMTECLMTDPEIVSVYNNIIKESETHIDQEITDNLLEKMLKLYLRVRAFSLAKDITGKHSAASKAKKAKGLRKTIKKSSDKPAIAD